VAYSFLALSRAEAWHCSAENEEVPRKAAVITEMIIILTMRLAGVSRFLWQERSFCRIKKEEADKKSAEGCDPGRKSGIRKDKEQ